MISTTRNRFLQLCAAAGIAPRDVFPKHWPADVAERCLEAALSGRDSDDELRQVAGRVPYQAGFGSTTTGSLRSFSDLRQLVRTARARLGALERELAELQAKRDELAALLDPTTPRPDDPAAVPEE